jgi:hypothetical protein
MHRQSNRAFGLLFGLLFSVISVVGVLAFRADMRWSIACAFSFMLVAIIIPSALLPLNRLWALVGERLAYMNNHVVLGIFFYLVIVPAGFLRRAIAGDSMCRRFEPKKESYWVPVGRQSNVETLSDFF